MLLPLPRFMLEAFAPSGHRCREQDLTAGFEILLLGLYEDGGNRSASPLSLSPASWTIGLKRLLQSASSSLRFKADFQELKRHCEHSVFLAPLAFEFKWQVAEKQKKALDVHIESPSLMDEHL